MEIRNELAKLLISGANTHTANTETQNNVFYASILMGVTINIVDDSDWDENCPKTAHITIIDGKYEINFHKQFCEGLLEEYGGYTQILAVLQHEVEHMIRGHLTSRWTSILPNNFIANIAQDCAINQYGLEKRLPSGGITLEFLKRILKINNILPEQSSKYYYDLIVNNLKDQDPKDLLFDYIDYDQTEEALQESAQTQFDSYVKKVLQESPKLRGMVPSHLEEDIARLFKPKEEKVNWRHEIKLFAETIKSTHKKSTFMKPNFRFPDLKGKRSKKKCHLLFCRDTSGSVSTEELLEACNEMYHLYKKGVTFDVLDVDAVAYDVYSFKGKFNPVKGRGDTDFQPAIDYYNKNSKIYNGMIYFTDGECDTSKNAPKRLLWIISSKGYFNQNLPGKKIKIK